MEDKRQGAYQAYADEEYRGQLPFSLPIAHRPQQGRSLLKRIIYGFFLVIAACSLTLTACRYIMTTPHVAPTELSEPAVQLEASLDLDNGNHMIMTRDWEVHGFTDEACQKFESILGSGGNADLEQCKPIASTAGLGSVRFYGYQAFSAYGACIYEWAACDLNNALTYTATTFCVTLREPGAANRIFVKDDNAAC